MTGTPNSPIITIDQLRKTYRVGWLRRSRREALRGVSLQVHAGEVFGILGPNGAGKTTMIKILLGIVRKSSGSAQLMGQRAGSQASRRLVGYLPENLRIAKHHTARSALDFYGRLGRMSSSMIRQRSDGLLQMVGLGDRDRESVKNFSKGMGQRLGLAQALLHDPQLLILDEPTDGLDPLGRSQVREIIGQLKSQGKTVFLNSHILQEVELICDRFAIMDQGQIRGVGTIAQLRGGPQALAATIIVSGIGSAEVQRCNAAGSFGLSDEELSDGRLRLNVPPCEQSQLNRVIDALRSEGASIHQLIQQEASLEDIYRSLVQSSGDG